MAPTLTWGNHDPIWAGLGASVKIPTEQFRDGVFATDILSVDGPGRMELFRYNPDDGPAQINRILSSTSTGWALLAAEQRQPHPQHHHLHPARAVRSHLPHCGPRYRRQNHPVRAAETRVAGRR